MIKKLDELDLFLIKIKKYSIKSNIKKTYILTIVYKKIYSTIRLIDYPEFDFVTFYHDHNENIKLFVIQFWEKGIYKAFNLCEEAYNEKIIQKNKKEYNEVNGIFCVHANERKIQHFYKYMCKTLIYNYSLKNEVDFLFPRDVKRVKYG